MEECPLPASPGIIGPGNKVATSLLQVCLQLGIYTVVTTCSKPVDKKV